MNNKNKILVGCLALLLALSVGYAYFSDTITINGTATAKGSFDMTATCEVVTSENATDEEKGIVETVGGTGVCEVNDDTITTTSNLTKPGDRVFYRIIVKNDGTIPSILKSISSPNNTSYISTSGNITPGDKVYLDEEYYLIANYGIISDGAYEEISNSDIPAANITFQPADQMVIYIAHGWGNVLWKEQPEVPEDGATLNYNITMNFDQVTN